jgi:acid phosphatase family membrane protein YuiD
VKKNKKIEYRYLLSPGHMPSAHTAFVISLATTVAYFDGVFSTTFAISIVLSYIVIYDAANIRTNIGYNGEIVNHLIREIPGIKKENYPILKEVVGHKPMEVLAGAILGFILTVLLIILIEKL